MQRQIRKFNSFEEQEKFALDQMRQTTVAERFKSLLQMQQWTKLFHPEKDTARKITIQKNGFAK